VDKDYCCVLAVQYFRPTLKIIVLLKNRACDLYQISSLIIIKKKDSKKGKGRIDSVSCFADKSGVLSIFAS
jgi:hypothetical protein